MEMDGLTAPIMKDVNDSTNGLVNRAYNPDADETVDKAVQKFSTFSKLPAISKNNKGVYYEICVIVT